MGLVTLVTRLAARDLRNRPAEVALVLLAITAAMTTLAVGLTVRDLVRDPYQGTRDATSGPDVVAMIGSPPGEALGEPSGLSTDVAALEELAGAEGVIGHSGPFPVAGAEMQVSGRTMDVQAIGRDTAPASVDQPLVTDGGWVEDGGLVVEAAFAAARDLRVGDRVTLDGQPFEIVGVAITAASAPYPETTCFTACIFGASPAELEALDPPAWLLREPGLVWVTRSDAIGLALDPDAMTQLLSLRLEHPDQAVPFADEHAPSGPGEPAPVPWQEILERSSHMVRDAQKVLLLGSGLLILMAMATVAIVVGGRVAVQSRRVGLLKAVGGTPRLVAAVLLTEYVVVALCGAAIGLTLGWLLAPLLTEPSAGLVGAPAPGLSTSTIALVTGVALMVAAVATSVPAVRAARTSTATALAEMASPPRRSRRLIAISSRLPAPLLLASRILGRRPRRVVLSIFGVAVTVSGLVAAVAARPGLDEQLAAGGFRAESVERLWPVMMTILITLVALACVNAVFIAWVTVIDTRQTAAVSRALGATPQQVSWGLAVAQVLPALAGAILGVPGGIAFLLDLDDGVPTLPPFWHLAAVVPVAVAVITLLVAIPARAGGRRPVVEILRSEHA